MTQKILLWPDAILRTPSKEIGTDDIPLLSTLVDDMIETMYSEKGLGLSAIQIGNDSRVFVLDIGLGPEVYFNSMITDFVGEVVTMNEGCLSVPGFYTTIQRNLEVQGHAFDRDGKPFDFASLPGTPEQKLNRFHTIQHESEHLNGEIFLDHLSQGKRDQARTWMKKVRKAL